MGAERLNEVHPNRDDERDVRSWRASDGDLRCQNCGRPNVVWYADNDLWNRVMPDDGILCIGCFIHRAEAYIGHAAWGLFADPAPFKSEFRRGFEAGMAARIVQARAGEGALRERIEALAAEWLAAGDAEGATAADDRVIGAWYGAGCRLRAALDPEATT